MYTSRLILATLFAVAVTAGTIPRQIAGSDACNAARAKVVGSLSDAGTAIGQIANTTTQTAAQTGLNQANGGVKTIAQSLIAGQQAPDAGRQAVEAGLVAMNSALAGGNANDAAVADAQTAVGQAAAAGEDVIAEC